MGPSLVQSWFTHNSPLSPWTHGAHACVRLLVPLGTPFCSSHRQEEASPSPHPAASFYHPSDLFFVLPVIASPHPAFLGPNLLPESDLQSHVGGLVSWTDPSGHREQENVTEILKPPMKYNQVKKTAFPRTLRESRTCDSEDVSRG